jgi:hypothetical protein
MVLSADDRRMNRGSAFLLGVAVVCGTATVTFGIWMASYSQHLHG